MAEPHRINHLLFINNEIKWEQGGVSLVSPSLHHPWARWPQDMTEGERRTWQPMCSTSRVPDRAGGGLRAQFGLADASRQREGSDIHLWDARPEGTSSPFAETSPQTASASHFFRRKAVFAVEGAGCAVTAWDPHTPFSFWARAHDFAGCSPDSFEGEMRGPERK